MAVTKEQKQELLKKFATGDLDTGSPQVQIAILTERITQLTQHFVTHKKDHHGRRGLVHAVNRRRKLLDYLARKDQEGYQKILKTLEIRK
jgi:small subunit ribosomal protein S15